MNKILALALLLLALTSPMLVPRALAAENDFPEVGKTYRIEFPPSSLETHNMIPAFGVRSPTVKILARGNGGWCLVEYRSFEGHDPTGKPVATLKTVWLNFNQVLVAIPQ